mmetsp:Transcript_23563/g.27658  ORF Transcript_23563/g.27658 Transcript_23563/m.27658 type:complete len:106 (+) Transcript_23563:16-333(+)
MLKINTSSKSGSGGGGDAGADQQVDKKLVKNQMNEVNGSAEFIVQFMEGIGLSVYTPALLSLGYDDPSIWPLLTEEDFLEMCELSHMLPGHRAKLATALRQADWE